MFHCHYGLQRVSDNPTLSKERRGVEGVGIKVWAPGTVTGETERGREQNSQKKMKKRTKVEQERKGMRSHKNPVLSAENWGDPIILMTGNCTSIGLH